jgi:hypothetical protein
VKFTHQEIQELFQRSLQEPLSPEQLIIVNNHMAVCPDCALYRYELSILEERLPRALAAEYPEPRISRTDMARVLYRHRERTRRSRLFGRFFSLAQQAAFATAGVALVAALAILAAYFGPRPQPASQVQGEPPALAAAPIDDLLLPSAPAIGSGEVYNSEQFSIQIQVPVEWQLVQQDSHGEIFTGDDGFVKLATLPLPFDSLDLACAAEADSQPDLYGESPQINRVIVQDFEACLIIGDPDDNDDPPGVGELTASINALVVEDTRREPEERFWVLAADAGNFDMLASSLQIMPEEEVVAGAVEPAPEPLATPIVILPGLSITAVEVAPDVQVRLTGDWMGPGDGECIKSELHIGGQAPEWWPRDNCAALLPDGKWEIIVSLDELTPPGRIDADQQNRFKVYWAGGSQVHDWAYYPAAWAGLTLEEHAVIPAAEDSPMTSGFDFKKRIPDSITEKHAGLRELSPEQVLGDLNQALAPFGYRLEAGSQVHQLLRNDERLSEGITHFYPIALNDDGTDFALVFEDPRGNYLLQKDGMVEWDAARHLFIWPVYVGSDLIAVEQGAEGLETVNVLRSGEVVFTLAVKPSVANPVQSLQSYNGQWVLETSETVIIDGEDLRNMLEIDEIFNWQVLGDQPFFFFIKDGKVGLTYNGQVLPVQYEQVIHRQCCEPAVFNPAGNSQMVWFYALKDDIWHYVELGMLY